MHELVSHRSPHHLEAPFYPSNTGSQVLVKVKKSNYLSSNLRKNGRDPMSAPQDRCSVAKSCPTLCDPMDCSMPGFPVHHQLLELAQMHAHGWWCHPSISSSITHFSCLQSFPASGSFPINRLFASGGQNIGGLASASVLPMNIRIGFL